MDKHNSIYRGPGIVLKTIPLGEADKIATILMRDFGLVRVVATGARKQKSQLRGRTELFVVDDFVIVRGRSLDRISQADLLQNFPKLRGSLPQLTVAQYWGEVVLLQALSQQPQEALYLLLLEHLDRLHSISEPIESLPLLVHGLYHFLAIAGIAPQVLPCAQCPGTAEWSFSPDGGGVACPHCINLQRPMQRVPLPVSLRSVLKCLPKPTLPELETIDVSAWLTMERLLRQSIQYHFDRTVQSASLIDNCFRLDSNSSSAVTPLEPKAPTAISHTPEPSQL